MSRALKSPCYDCDIWKKHGSPDYLLHCGGPSNCSKHRAYDRKIGPAGVGGAPIASIVSEDSPEPTTEMRESSNLAAKIIKNITKDKSVAPKTKECKRKECKKAGELQPVENFGKNKREKDGLQIWCKTCQAEYGKKQRDKKKADTQKLLNKYRESKKQESHKPIYDKICSNINCGHGGKLQPIENFYGNKNTDDKKSSWCKDCTRDARNKKYQKNRLEKIKLATDDQIIEQLFAGHEHLLDGLKELADAQFRSVKNQLLYMVSEWKE